MAEIYTKNDKGEFEKIGAANASQLSRIKNDANIEAIAEDLDSFWTEKKVGKHPELKNVHGTILMKDLKVPAKDFFEQVNSNTFTFQNFGPFSWGKFLKNAKIDLYVNDSYLEDCLKVVTARPAIGRGEFLFAATFNNINFATGKGDLIDDEGNRIEVKGKHANFGGEGPFKQMNKSLIDGIYSMFKTSTHADSLNIAVMEDLQKKLVDNKELQPKVLALLQNLENHSQGLTNQMVRLFSQTEDLKLTIAAAHLLAYMKMQKANYLLALNDNVYYGFKAPKDIMEAAEIMKNFNITGWVTGNKGISFTVKNG